MKARLSLAGLIAATALVAILLLSGERNESVAGAEDPYEVWALDQRDTRAGYGGLLHIYGGPALTGNPTTAVPETIDLGGEVSDTCQTETGARPVRPHMLAFNGGDRQGVEFGRYAIISWVASGHVTIHDARTRQTLDCLRSSAGAGGARQAHAAWPTADGRHLIVANQNGKQIERISTDWANKRFEFEPAAKLELFTGQTPNGIDRQEATLRPDNAPICIRPTYDGRYSFVSLRGGGMFVVDHNATPIRIVAEYDRSAVKDNGCGQIEQNSGGKVFFNSGADATASPQPATPTNEPYGHALYSLDLAEINPAGNAPNQPRPRVSYDRPGPADGHGVALVRGQTQLLSTDRERNDISVVDFASGQLLERFSLEGRFSSDPAPDLVATSPDGQHVFTTLRGPTSQTGGHPAVGNTPGVGVIRLAENDAGGRLAGIAPARRSDTAIADPHGLNVRVNFTPTGQSLALASRLTVRGVHRLASVRRSGLPLRFVLNQGATVRADLKMRPASARRLKLPSARIAKIRTTIASGGSYRVNLRLTPRAARALARQRRVHVTLTTVSDSSVGRPIRDTRTLLLRR